jgi:hypothetical protein
LLRNLYRKAHIYVPKKMLFHTPKPAADDDKIIVFDTLVTPQYLYWLCKSYPDKRIILWYWNPVGNNRKFELFPRRVEVWSYSPADCASYGFRYNTQFYFDSIVDGVRPTEAEANPKPKALFIGREKGRRQQVLDIMSLLEESGAETETHLMKDGTRGNRKAEQVTPYGEVVEKICGCDVIVDYTLNEHAGLSLRPMEALFLNKKLITNNKSIRQYRFYKRENIYILGDEQRSLGEFLAGAYVSPDPDVRDYYRLSNWVKRFDQQEDALL